MSGESTEITIKLRRHSLRGPRERAPSSILRTALQLSIFNCRKEIRVYRCHFLFAATIYM